MSDIEFNADWQSSIDLSAHYQWLGEQITTEMRSNAPVETGHLADSCFFVVHDDHLEVGNSAEYAAYVEYGTEDQRAEPFARPAVYKRRFK